MIRSRPYVDDDLPRLQSALASWIQEVGDCGYYHVGNIPHRIYAGYSGRYPAEELVQVWENGTSIVGLTFNFVFDVAFFVFTSPAYRGSDIELAMLQAAYETTHRLLQETRRRSALAEDASQTDISVITDVYNCDHVRMDLLTQLGFEQYRLWDYITERSLSGSLPEPKVPDGFTIRSATMDDCAQLAAARNSAFGGNWTPEAYRDQVMRKPGYEPEREIVVETPNGQLAAFTIIWLDVVNKVGQFEPVGTHRDFQRRGLARAMMFYALAEMKRQGMETAIVEHTADNLPALELYRSLGFEKKYETLGYRRVL